MGTGAVTTLIFAILLAIYAIVSIIRKKLCITIVGKTESGERKWTTCTEGTKAVIWGVVILLVAIGLGIGAILI
jgi:hypothetical protein